MRLGVPRGLPGQAPRSRARAAARLFYGQASAYSWWDDAGVHHSIPQGEGCQQGAPLAPALRALGQHEALRHASDGLRPGESLLAYLDDLYVVTSRDRARAGLDEVARAVETHCGIAANLGKTRVFSYGGGPPPRGIAELGAEVWRGSLPPRDRGLVVLGTPVGSDEFVRAWGDGRVAEEAALLEQLPLLPDLQCAWLLLLFCASPRANHALRAIPPHLAAHYAAAHDAAVWGTLQACVGEQAEDADSPARAVALLPASLGGLGLLSAVRASPGAYWAAWADALAVLQPRCPNFVDSCLRSLTTGSGPRCLREAEAARRLLHAEGWGDIPAWAELAQGASPPLRHGEDAEPGEWAHGWQCRASRIRNLFFCDRALLPSLFPSHQAMLRSQGGPRGPSGRAR